MKRFRFGFLAIVSVLAIGLTAATKVHEINAASTYVCREGIDFTRLDGDFKKCLGSVIIPTERRNDDFHPPVNISPETTCPGEGYYAIKSLTAGSILDEDNFECTTGTAEFCCARLVSNELPGTCVETKYPVSVEIFCKTAD